ncbi:hypothetical protein BX070DRAFT_225315 [Coemansia spiralis]|nr:hypothetical protein BX070DRAFT_225315 [Coemansia spiralis]
MASKGPQACQRETWDAYYASSDVIERFEGIVDSIVTEAEIAASTAPTAADVPQINAELLSKTTHNIQVAQENVYGKNAKAETKGYKLPTSLFSVPQSGVVEQSSLYNILSAAIEYSVLHSIELGNPDWAISNSDGDPSVARGLLEAVRLKLADNKQIPIVNVYFNNNIAQEKQQGLSDIVRALGGRVVDSQEDATHVVDNIEVKGSFSDVAGGDSEREDVWFRTLEKRDSQVLVHWWYTPDSYDAWLPAEPPYNAEPEDAAERTGTWHVSLQWLEDSSKFNELMNEEDYESNSASDSVPGSANSTKRRAHALLEGEEKRLRVDGDNSDAPDGVEVHNIQDNQPGTGNRKRNEFEPLPHGELANVLGEDNEDVNKEDDNSMDVDKDKEEEEEDKNKKGEDGQDESGPVDEQLQREEDARRLLVEQTQEVIIPSYAAWFNLSSIHENERRALPEFFNSRNMSKTPTIYKEYRNFMVNSYRLNPSEYLTVTACRRNLAGDVCAIMRVHAFLEQWGLINYQSDADSRPSTIGPPFTGHFRISADTPRGLVPFQPSISSAQLAGGKKATDSGLPMPQTSAGGLGTSVAGGLALRKNIYDSPTIATEAAKSAREINAAEPPATTKDVFCHTCGVNCTSAYYHCIRNLRQRVDLCAPCYLDGRFPGTLSSSDFVKLTESTAKQPGSGDDWTDQETLMLLEGIEMYDDDWNRIAEHIGTRSREECVLHFLKLPIEDPYDVAPLKDTRGSQDATMPFSRADNPVMSVVAFLASNVNPGVAAAAAKAALAELTKPSSDSTSNNVDSTTTSASGADEDSTKEQEKVDEQQAEQKIDVDTEKKEPAEGNGMEIDGEENKYDTSNDTKDNGTTAGTQKESSTDLPPKSQLEYAASVALGAAAAKAAKLAEYEERQLENMVHRAVELQMSKLELKMRQFEEMETALEQERKDLARQRQQLVEECWALKKKMALFESGAASRIADAHSSNVFQANDNVSQISQQPTAPPPKPVTPPAPAHQESQEQQQPQVSTQEAFVETSAVDAAAIAPASLPPAPNNTEAPAAVMAVSTLPDANFTTPNAGVSPSIDGNENGDAAANPANAAAVVASVVSPSLPTTTAAFGQNTASISSTLLATEDNTINSSLPMQIASTPATSEVTGAAIMSVPDPALTIPSADVNVSDIHDNVAEEQDTEGDSIMDSVATPAPSTPSQANNISGSDIAAIPAAVDASATTIMPAATAATVEPSSASINEAFGTNDDENDTAERMDVDDDVEQQAPSAE